MKIPVKYIKAALLHCQGRFPFLTITEGTPEGSVLYATDGASAIKINLGGFGEADWLSKVSTPTRVPVSIFEGADLSGGVDLSEKDGTIYLVTERAIASEAEYSGKDYPIPYVDWFPPTTGDFKGHTQMFSLSILSRAVDTLRLIHPDASSFPVRFAQSGVKVEVYTGDRAVRMMVLPLKP